MNAIEELLKIARVEQQDLWNKLSYRSETHQPTVMDISRWVDRLKQLNAIIEFLKKHLEKK